MKRAKREGAEVASSQSQRETEVLRPTSGQKLNDPNSVTWMLVRTQLSLHKTAQ